MTCHTSFITIPHDHDLECRRLNRKILLVKIFAYMVWHELGSQYNDDFSQDFHRSFITNLLLRFARGDQRSTYIALEVFLEKEFVYKTGMTSNIGVKTPMDLLRVLWEQRDADWVWENSGNYYHLQFRVANSIEWRDWYYDESKFNHWDLLHGIYFQ